MTPAQTARENLTDYLGQIESWVVTPIQTDFNFLVGSRWWRAALVNRCDNREVGSGMWTQKLTVAASDLEELLTERERALEKEAEEKLEAELAETAS